MKSADKLIVVIGVVIIILAAIGIFLWKPTAPQRVEKVTAEKEYIVNWVERTETAKPDSDKPFFAYDKIFGSEPYSANVTIPEYNLKSVRFILTWEDDHVYGLLFKRGKDTLTFEVTAPDGTKVSKDSVMNGTLEISFDNINQVPSITKIKANSTSEAMEMLKDYYGSKWKDQPFKINVSVKVGEKIFRPIKRLMDRGNNFSLEIEYTYYEASVESSSTSSTLSPSTTAASTTSEIESMSLREKMYPVFAYPGFH